MTLYIWNLKPFKFEDHINKNLNIFCLHIGQLNNVGKKCIHAWLERRICKKVFKKFYDNFPHTV